MVANEYAASIEIPRQHDAPVASIHAHPSMKRRSPAPPIRRQHLPLTAPNPIGTRRGSSGAACRVFAHLHQALNVRPVCDVLEEILLGATEDELRSYAAIFRRHQGVRVMATRDSVASALVGVLSACGKGVLDAVSTVSWELTIGAPVSRTIFNIGHLGLVLLEGTADRDAIAGAAALDELGRAGLELGGALAALGISPLPDSPTVTAAASRGEPTLAISHALRLAIAGAGGIRQDLSPSELGRRILASLFPDRPCEGLIAAMLGGDAVVLAHCSIASIEEWLAMIAAWEEGRTMTDAATIQALLPPEEYDSPL